MKSLSIIKIILSAAMPPSFAALSPWSHAQTSPAIPSTLVNASVLARSSPSAPSSLGFVVAGAATKNVLLRGVGPSLSQFGVENAMIDPVMSLFENSIGLSLSNDWGTDDQAMTDGLNGTFALCQAFDLAPGSEDSAAVTAINPDSYSLQVCGALGDSGEALAEVYDLDGAGASAAIVNFSGCAYVDPANGDLIAGFTLGGDSGATVLIRGVGPSLSLFGYAAVLPNPQLELFNSDGVAISAIQSWNDDAALQAAFGQVGAFSLVPGSTDAALLVTLDPGSYTVHLSDVNGVAGWGLAEVYLVQ